METENPKGDNSLKSKQIVLSYWWNYKTKISGEKNPTLLISKCMMVKYNPLN